MNCAWCGNTTDMIASCDVCHPPLLLCRTCCMHKSADGYFAQPPPKVGMRTYASPIIQAPDTAYAAPSSTWSDDSWREWNAFNTTRSDSEGSWNAPGWNAEENRASMWTSDRATSASSSAPAPSQTWSNRLAPDVWHQGAFSSQTRWDYR